MSQASPDPFVSELLSAMPALRRRAGSLCGNRSDADDLVQDAVLRALEYRSSYTPGTHLSAWAMQILFSQFATRHRRGKRERVALGRFGSDETQCERLVPAPETQSLSPRLREALGNLPARISAVVRLVDLEEHSYREAAASLDVPVGTVMSRLSRGRQRIAAAVQDANLGQPCARAA